MWKTSKLGSRGTILWEFVLCAVSWVLWTERNNRIFEGVSHSSEQLLLRGKGTIWSWAMDLPIMRNLKIENLIFFLGSNLIVLRV